MSQTKRVLRLVMPLIAIVCTVIFVPWLMLWVWLSPLPATVQQEVEQATNYKLDGMIVYVDEGSKAPVLYASGWKDRDSQIPSDPHAFFKIASISKLYIAAAACKLVYQQKLSLDDTLEKLLPQLNGRIANAERITFGMLLRHSSGIQDYLADSNYPWDSPIKDNWETIKLVWDKPADFEPGTSHSYSNTNYVLIGEILDRVLGYSHHQFIREEILLPLNLSHTYSLLQELDPKLVSSGYAIGYDKDVKLNDYVSPGGSMVATAEDVGIFLRALIDGSLFNKEEQAIYSSVYYYEHTGLLPGYQSIAKYHQDIDTIVVQFVNTSGGESWTISEIIYNRIIKILRRQSSI